MPDVAKAEYEHHFAEYEHEAAAQPEQRYPPELAVPDEGAALTLTETRETRPPGG